MLLQDSVSLNFWKMLLEDNVGEGKTYVMPYDEFARGHCQATLLEGTPKNIDTGRCRVLVEAARGLPLKVANSKLPR
jgi:hypothetical protein